MDNYCSVVYYLLCDYSESYMNWTIIVIETIVLLLAFTAAIMIPLIKNPVWWIHDYPKEIQERYFETHERIPTQFFSAKVLAKKGFAVLLCSFFLVLMIWPTGADSFLTAFAVSYGMWMIIDWYDCFFLDWVLFANVKAVRLPGTEDMDMEYHQKRYHVVRSLWGMLLGLIPCMLASLIFII